MVRSFYIILLSTMLLFFTGCGSSSEPSTPAVSGTQINTIPTATPQTIIVSENISKIITLAGFDTDNDSLTYQVVTQPTNGTLSGTAPIVTYTPTNGFIGTDAFTFKVNDGKDDSAIAKITIDLLPNNETPSIQAVIDRVSQLHNDDSIVPMTNEEYRASKFAKNQIDETNRTRINYAFELVSLATDPDPEWFATKLSSNIIVANASSTYNITARKLDIDSNDLGPVDQDKLKFVVKIQHDKNTFETIADSDIDNYVRWTSTVGELEIIVPDSLNQGRLLVGIRPDFQNEKTNAIAERWSAAISVEVWTLKTNVISLTTNNVLFPLEGVTNGFSTTSTFTKEEVATKVRDSIIQDENILLPLVVSGVSFSEGQLIDYQIKGYPYSGRIEKITTRGNQQFLLLAPTWFDIYEITDAEDGFLASQGILPSDIIYKNEESKFKSSRSTKKKPGLFSFFKSNCEAGKSALALKPFISLFPFDAGLNFNYNLTGDTVKCTWKANKDQNLSAAADTLLMASGGVVTILMKALLGTDIDINPYGEFTLKIESETPVILGVSAGWSVKDGADARATFTPVGAIIDSKLVGVPRVITGEAGAGGGIEYKLNLASAGGVLGFILGWLDINIPDIGLKAKAGLEGALALTSANAAAVYMDGELSKGSANYKANMNFSASTAIKKLLRYLEYESSLELNVDINLLEGKFYLNYVASNVEDDYYGKASVEKLTTDSIFLDFLLSSLDVNGKMGPDDITSSIFEDNSGAITYELDECDANGNQILAPVIACQGIFCGKSNEVKVCGDPTIPTFSEWSYHISDSFLDWTSGPACKAGGGQMVGYLCENRDSALTDESTLLPAASRFFEYLGGGCQLATTELTWPLILPIWMNYVRVTQFVNGKPIKQNDKATSKPSNLPKNNCNNILYDAFFTRSREVLCSKGFHLSYIGSESPYLGDDRIVNRLAVCKQSSP